MASQADNRRVGPCAGRNPSGCLSGSDHREILLALGCYEPQMDDDHEARTVYNYAVDEVGFHFLPWTACTKRDRAWTISDAIEVVNAEKGRINTTLPAHIAGK